MLALNAEETLRACRLLARLYHPRNQVYGKGIRVPRTFPPEELLWLRSVGLTPNQLRRDNAGALLPD